MIDERAVRAQLDQVLDPELDQPLTELGFIHQVDIREAEVVVRFRLPTFWCAPNFAYMMAADVRERVARVPGVRVVRVLLEDHFAGEEIAEGVNAGRRFGEVFPGDAEADLEELRRTFARKAYLIRQEQLMRALLRAGFAPEHLAALRLGDVRAEGDALLIRAGTEAPGAEGAGAWRPLPGLARPLAVYRQKRAAAGLPPRAGDPLFTTAEGDPLPADRVMDHLRASRMIRLNGVFNTLLCTGLNHVFHGVAVDAEALCEGPAADASPTRQHDARRGDQ